MQPIRCLERALRSIASPQNYLFSIADLSTILPEHDRNAITQIASRAISAGFLSRACQGVYLLADTPRTGHELFHIAAKLRAGFFNYISQETILSEAGIISQILVSRVTIMTSGRSAQIPCGTYGTIEFTHTKRDLASLASRLDYDGQRRMLCAPVGIAWEDLRAARRNLHLVDKEALVEYLAR
jgi:predicted transcriptional regulator of viral defense system